jgi:23S rRNA pseudouridine2605 synthase
MNMSVGNRACSLLLVFLSLCTALHVPLDRVLVRSGGLNRRADARQAILAGRVEVDGRLQISNARIRTDQLSSIRLDGEPLPPPPPTVVLALHKPRGLWPESVMASVDRPDAAPGMAAVGRLDPDSEGLLLLTNDGTLARLMLEPGLCEKTYVCLCSPTRPHLDVDRSLRDAEAGVPLQGGYVGRAHRCQVLEVGESDNQLLGRDGAALFTGLLDERGRPAAGGEGACGPQMLVEVVMRQGARREVRRLLKGVGLKVMRLCRVRIGTVALCDLSLRSGEAASLGRADQRRLYERCLENVEHGTPIAAMTRYDCEIERWHAILT